MGTIIAAVIAALIAGMVLGARRERARSERAARPMKMLHAFSCRCGCDTTCQREELAPGAVFTCPKCSQVWGHITPGGNRKWIKLNEEQIPANVVCLPGIGEGRKAS